MVDQQTRRSSSAFSGLAPVIEPGPFNRLHESHNQTPSATEMGRTGPAGQLASNNQTQQPGAALPPWAVGSSDRKERGQNILKHGHEISPGCLPCEDSGEVCTRDPRYSACARCTAVRNRKSECVTAFERATKLGLNHAAAESTQLAKEPPSNGQETTRAATAGT